MKKCTKCKVEKPFDEFWKHPLGKNGLCPSCKSCAKQYQEANKERRAEYDKQHYEANKERKAELNKQWFEFNKERRAEYNKQRRQTDSIFKFRHNVRTLIANSFKRGTNQFRKNTKTETILGCTIEEFRIYIQSQFKKGMYFNNHGEWHLDHIIPLASASTEEEIIKLNHYTNFQPLWAEENFKKSNKIVNNHFIHLTNES